MKENLIEVAQYDGPGYRALVYYEGWRVAFLNDDPSKYRRETIPYLERHNETDELFVLLEGSVRSMSRTASETLSDRFRRS